MEDARAVLDAVGSERLSPLGVSEGGPMSILFAATYPERAESLLLCGAEVKEETFGRLQSAAMTPRDAVAMMDMAFEIDVRDVIPAVRVPTLVVQRVDDPIVHVENAAT